VRAVIRGTSSPNCLPAASVKNTRQSVAASGGKGRQELHHDMRSNYEQRLATTGPWLAGLEMLLLDNQNHVPGSAGSLGPRVETEIQADQKASRGRGHDARSSLPSHTCTDPSSWIGMRSMSHTLARRWRTSLFAIYDPPADLRSYPGPSTFEVRCHPLRLS